MAEAVMHPSQLPDPLVANKIVVTSTCWLWTGSCNDNGYAHFVRKRNGKQTKRYVHRYTYEHFVGPIPPGYEVHHDCENRVCCNPEHLIALTHNENIELRELSPNRGS